MKLRIMTLLFVLCLFSGKLRSQDNVRPTSLPWITIKSNLLSDVATTFNLGGELRLTNRWTLELPLSYNPWSFSEDKKMKHFLVQPEARYWLCESFNGHFFGLHAHYGIFNIGGIGVTDWMKDHRFEGWLVGAGVSYGYQWILSNRFSLEATIGVGYAYLDYGLYPCGECERKISDKTKNYVGPTKLGLSLIYVIK